MRNIPGVKNMALCVFMQACVWLPANAQTSLHLPSMMSYITVGDLDIPGDQLTVEALIFPTDTGYDVVSKHLSPSDVNYLLRPTQAEITTTNGYVAAVDTTGFKLNQCYHIAMVYDGVNLTFYVNGCIAAQEPCTGDMVLNDYETNIGNWAGAPTSSQEQFLGFINEVRIWNVARSQSLIQQYMFSSIPSASTQTGLLAYYVFDNLLNDQGNAAYNGTINGGALTAQADISCSSTGSLSSVITKTDVKCNGDSNGTATASPSGGIPPYTYSWNTNPVQTTQTATNLAPGQYVVTITDNSCLGGGITDTVIIGEPAPLAVTTSGDVTISKGDSTVITAGGGTTYTWSPSTGLSCTTCPDPTAGPLVTTTYIVTVQDANGCTGTDTLTVFVTDSIPCQALFIPSAFSPNGDGSNEVLRIRGSCIREMYFSVYNRWGGKVFETTDPAGTWDGMNSGGTGIYVYNLRVVFTSGAEEARRGNVTLVR